MKFVDSAKVFIASGKGGDGCVAWRREKNLEFGGPDGGNGGRGGHVYFKGEPGLYSLYDLRLNPHIKAKNGKKGAGRNKSGEGGADVTVKVPFGTVLVDVETELVVAEILDSSVHLICEGGRGGVGNNHFKSSVRQAPDFFIPGQAGQSLTLRLDLKVLADIGLVGLPNAGKSTFIGSVTNARPEVASYPFTTINPHLGVVVMADYSRMVLADVPGIIEGAARGLGLGHRFLRHLERCKQLLFLLDSSDTAMGKPLASFKQLLHELTQYDAELAAKPKLIAFTKSDLEPDKAGLLEAKKYFDENEIKYFTISALEKVGLEELLNYLAGQFRDKK